MARSIRGNGAVTGKSGRYTVVGLFETTLDAEQTLIALRKAARPPEQISVLVRGRENGGQREDGAGAVARALVESALDAVGGWLTGLAALIIPRSGTYLVAGPLGAALAGMRGKRGNDESSSSRSATVGPVVEGSPHDDDEILQILIAFGFQREEAAYIDHRLEAGDAVVAVTTGDRNHLKLTRRLFAAHDAVHIGQARTREAVAHEAFALLAAPIAAGDGADLVVADATAPLRRLCEDIDAQPWVLAMCGQLVVDRGGEEVGVVDDLLADALVDGDAEDRRREVRYVVIGFGGVLGLGRRHTAVPAGLVSFESTPAQLSVTEDFLGRAPEYDPEAPFSRREEQSIFAYFGVTPYWSE